MTKSMQGFRLDNEYVEMLAEIVENDPAHRTKSEIIAAYVMSGINRDLHNDISDESVITEEVERLHTDNDVLKEENRTLGERNAFLTGEIAGLRKKYNKKLGRIHELESKLVGLEIEKELFEEQLESRQDMRSSLKKLLDSGD